MSCIAKPPIAPDVAEVIGECAENVESRSLLLDKFVLHKSWPMVVLDATRQPMRMDNASRWSFIRMAQNGDVFLRREIGNSERAANGRNASDKNREEAQKNCEVLHCLARCACRKLPGDLERQKLAQNRRFAMGLVKRPGRVAIVYGELLGRLIVNLSDSLVQNAGICLDRNTGLPFIPGSAVKGVARHVALAHLREGEWSIEEFMRVFGCSDVDFKDKGELCRFSDVVSEDKRTMKGGVDFLAAQPITEPTIVVDISNVHYPDYYQTGEIRDLANERPMPNTFPAVEKGVRYAFCIAANGMDGIDAVLFDRVRSVLVEAITVHGIGAKTGAGYGWFKDVTEDIEAEAKRNAEAEAARRTAEEAKAKEETARAEARANAERRAAMSVAERWQEVGAAAVCGKKGNAFSDAFAKANEAAKDEIVRVLRSSEGVGAEVWKMLRTDNKRKNQAAVDAVFKWAKDRKLGKMPS